MMFLDSSINKEIYLLNHPLNIYYTDERPQLYDVQYSFEYVFEYGKNKEY